METKMEPKDHIKNAADLAAKTYFVTSYCRPDNIGERQIEGLGIAIAHYAQWSAPVILKILSFALEDANYHEPSLIISALEEKLKTPEGRKEITKMVNALTSEIFGGDTDD